MSSSSTNQPSAANNYGFVPDEPTTSVPSAANNYGFIPDTGTSSHDKYGIPIGWPGTLQNLGAGLVNPLINTANLIPQGINWIGKELGKPSVHATLLPKIPHDPDSYSYTLGNIGSFLAPFSAASKGIEGAVDLGKGITGIAKELPTWAQKLGKVGVSTGAGAGAGFSTAPGSMYDRLRASEGGAIGGGLGEGAGQLIGRALEGIKNTGTFDKLSTLYKKYNPFDMTGNAAGNALKAIGKSYANARNQSVPLYNKIFNQLDKKGAYFAPNSLSNYQKVRSNLPYKESLLLKTQNDLLRPAMNAIDSRDVHFYKGRLESDAEKYQYSKPGLSAIYNEGAKALSMDLNKFLSQHGLKNSYDQASAAFKKHVAPFYNNAIFNKQIRPILNQNKEVINGETILNHAGIDEAARKSGIVSQFIPNQTEKSIGQFNQLKTLLGNDKEGAKLHAVDNLVAPFVKYDPDMGANSLNIKGFLNRVSNLSDEQKDFLFSPEDKKIINALHKAKATGSGNGRLTKAGDFAIPTYTGHLLHPHWGTLMGLTAAASGIMPKLRMGIANMLTPNETNELAHYILTPAPIRQIGLGRVANTPAALGAKLNNPDNSPVEYQGKQIGKWNE